MSLPFTDVAFGSVCLPIGGESKENHFQSIIVKLKMGGEILTLVEIKRLYSICA